MSLAQPDPSPSRADAGSPAPAKRAGEGELQAGGGDVSTNAEFQAFMDYEVRTHTPVTDFRERDEARIYAEMIDFLLARARGAGLPDDLVPRRSASTANGLTRSRRFRR